MHGVCGGCECEGLSDMGDGKNNNTNNIPENAADIIFPNLQESMRSNNQRAAIINHQKHK